MPSAPLAPKHYECNARVELTRTVFWIEGFQAEVVDFLGSLTSSLADLPLESLEDERRILRTEELAQPGGSVNNRLSARFGAGGFGIGDFWQYGLRWLEAEQVGDWARRWFNSSNCAVWIAGDLPDHLQLSLPPGERHDVPRAQPLTFHLPAATDAGQRGVAISLLGPRSVEMLVATHAIDRRVRMRVRHEQGISYSAGAGYLGLDNDTAELIISADSTAEHVREATLSILRTIEEFGEDGPTVEEVANTLDEHVRKAEKPRLALEELDRVATDHITGFSRNGWDALRDRFAETKPPAVASAVALAARQMLVILPEDTPLDFEGLTVRSLGEQQIGSTRILAMPGKNNPYALYFGPDGTSLVSPDTAPTYALAWRDIAVALWWSDGHRLLIGNSGSHINFSPEHWQQPQVFAEVLRQYVPPDAWVPMDEPGTPARTDEPRCSVCEATPAMEVHLTLWRPRQGQVPVIDVLCRDCGISEFRRCTSSAVWFLQTQPVLQNYREGRRIKALGPPVRTSEKQSLKKGLPVYLRPSMIVPLVWLGAFAGIIAIASVAYR